MIDDVCALMAGTGLWIATNDAQYREEARRRMTHLAGRMTPAGYFRADDSTRPFWHAADAGLPIVALVRYLDKETGASSRATALDAIKKALDYELAVTNDVGNPYGYARQSFLYQGAVRKGFFMPQDNETGWWWQGENARLASLAAAAILGGRVVYPAQNGWGVKDSLAAFAAQQLAWILGSNPYDVCFMDGFGKNNPPKIASNFGHGTSKGGSNGITGRKGAGAGAGIDYKSNDGGNEWRWIEQWIPHSGWFLTAAAAMAERPRSSIVATDAGSQKTDEAKDAGGNESNEAGSGGVGGANADAAGATGGSAPVARAGRVAERSGCSGARPDIGRAAPWLWALFGILAVRATGLWRPPFRRKVSALVITLGRSPTKGPAGFCSSACAALPEPGPPRSGPPHANPVDEAPLQAMLVRLRPGRLEVRSYRVIAKEENIKIRVVPRCTGTSARVGPESKSFGIRSDPDLPRSEWAFVASSKTHEFSTDLPPSRRHDPRRVKGAQGGIHRRRFVMPLRFFHALLVVRAT